MPESQTIKVLDSTNYATSGLQRPNQNYLPNYVIRKFRKHIVSLGYDCSLLTDRDITGLEDLIIEHIESNSGDLTEFLEYFVVEIR